MNISVGIGIKNCCPKMDGTVKLVLIFSGNSLFLYKLENLFKGSLKSLRFPVKFFSLSNCVDVLLIPLHFGGGNTSLEAMIFGTPSITMPENHLRTNITAAIYKQMKIINPPITKSTEKYIDLAFKLAKDSKKNNSLREKSKKAANKYLFKSHKTLKEFEHFLIKVHRKAK